VYRYNDAYWDGDFLIYNFNLRVGDSVFIDPAEDYSHVVLTDSTQVCGSYRKTIHFAHPQDVWIEGIGSLLSTFNPIDYYFLTDNTFQLLCVNDSLCQQYQNPSNSGCYVDTTMLAQDEKALMKPAILVSPDPVSKTCNISLKDTAGNSCELLLFDPQGNMVRDETHNNTSFVFDRKDLPSGLYLVKVICKDNVFNKRIIID